TMVTEKVGSAELTFFTVKTPAYAQKDDVLTYGRQLKSFLDACPNTFSGLARFKARKFEDKVYQRASLKFSVYTICPCSGTLGFSIRL
uniref:Uncharacterized protein n=1 Tax=Aegilops tauschii subsp. strangulata TaxID=200361 RepID=A0A453S5R9_AEGTS